MSSVKMPYLNRYQEEFIYDLGFEVRRQGSQLSVDGERGKVRRLQESMLRRHTAAQTWEHVNREPYPLAQEDQ